MRLVPPLAVAALLAATLTSQAPASAAAGPRPQIGKEPFGTLADGTKIDRYTLSSGHGMKVRILTYGGIVQSLEVPDGHGRAGNIALGFAGLDGYLSDTYKTENPYFGALIG